jgi:hypothetical protein
MNNPRTASTLLLRFNIMIALRAADDDVVVVLVVLVALNCTTQK